MSAHPGTVQHISNRLRVATKQAVAFVRTLDECTDDERAMLLGFIDFVDASAEALNPEQAIAAGERDTVVVPMLRAFR